MKRLLPFKTLSWQSSPEGFLHNFKKFEKRVIKPANHHRAVRDSKDMQMSIVI